MLYGILLTLFVAICPLLILLILIQKGKSSMGLGNLGGGSQMLFGGSGGQDIMQKVTWTLGALFMAGSLVLAKMKRPPQARFISALEATQAATTPRATAPVTAPAASTSPAQPAPVAPTAAQ